MAEEKSRRICRFDDSLGESQCKHLAFYPTYFDMLKTCQSRASIIECLNLMMYVLCVYILYNTICYNLSYVVTQ